MAIALPAGAIAASNLLVNPDFDDDIDPPWTASPAATFSLNSDADGCLQSGAMVLGAPSGTATAKQCVNVPADGTAYVARVRAREVIALGTVTGSVGVELFSGSDCSATHLIGLFSSDATVSTSWTKLVLAGGAGSVGAHSVKFTASFQSSMFFSVDVDRAFLGTSAPIFAEDHEVGELCRYSDAFP